jgi:hypothetical protein
MKKIKFSHYYDKIPQKIRGRHTWLVSVQIYDSIEQMPKNFVEYDTIYYDGFVKKNYPLPAGKVMLLVLFSDAGEEAPNCYIWTTIRSWNKQKEQYYRLLIGKEIKIEVGK